MSNVFRTLAMMAVTVGTSLFFVQHSWIIDNNVGRIEKEKIEGITKAIIRARDFAAPFRVWEIEQAEHRHPFIFLAVKNENLHTVVVVNSETNQHAASFLPEKWKMGDKLKLEFVGIADLSRSEWWSSYLKPIIIEEVADQ